MQSRPFQPGNRVIWRERYGTVVFMRMASPEYTTPEAYSVRLDDAHVPGYTGTMCSASEVWSAVCCECGDPSEVDDLCGECAKREYQSSAACVPLHEEEDHDDQTSG